MLDADAFNLIDPHGKSTENRRHCKALRTASQSMSAMVEIRRRLALGRTNRQNAESVAANPRGHLLISESSSRGFHVFWSKRTGIQAVSEIGCAFGHGLGCGGL
ncbi:hypothetical protein [Marinobacter bohaiensis]|uniref:hypothetical protein n=1 Tax=Marinobacter bohaiensis TaxID=2201898 RepID=UPI0013A6E01F|nr:hypothetical protein [Marinobacter bohaiensis]